MYLIIQPMHDWRSIEKDGFATRDAHFIECFLKNTYVKKLLLINRPLSLPEKLLKNKKYPIQKGCIFKKGNFWVLKKIGEKLFVLDIFSFDIFRPIIYRRDWWNLVFKQHRVRKIIKYVIETYFANKNKILFLGNPMAVELFELIKPDIFVFDALDNWLLHPEIKDSRGFIEKGYEFIAQKADLFYVNSNSSFNFFSKLRKDIKVLFNGVDIAYFQKEENKEIPEDMKPLKKKIIIGYAGKLAKRIDVELMLKIADRFKDVNIVIIGKVLDKNWIKPIFKKRNIHYLGNKNYEIYPKYLNNFDICIIPHNVGKFESGGDPIKLYEYLACKKPVITTNIEGVDRFEECIYIANSHESFLRYIEIILQNGDRKKKNCLKKEDTWEYKANKIINDIVNLLNIKNKKP